MRSYRRVLAPNATYFFTINLQNRKSDLLVRKIDVLRSVFINIQRRHPFYIDAIVILPDHCHIMMTLPEGETNYSTRISLIKSTFSRKISPTETISQSRKNKRERGIWQRRYWEHTIQNSQDYEHHVNYIHFNPVKHGYVPNPSDWKYSSIHRFIKQGILRRDWACSDVFGLLEFGE
jgi:putative transposase